MSNWQLLSNLLEQEYRLWQKLNQENVERAISMEDFLEKGYSFFVTKEEYLDEILQLQLTMEIYQKAIETSSERLSIELQQKIKQTMENIENVQTQLNQQEQADKKKLLQYQTQIKEEIKNYRNKRVVQTGYQSMPLLAESALMDKKN